MGVRFAVDRWGGNGEFYFLAMLPHPLISAGFWLNVQTQYQVVILMPSRAGGARHELQYEPQVAEVWAKQITDQEVQELQHNKQHQHTQIQTTQ